MSTKSDPGEDSSTRRGKKKRRRRSCRVYPRRRETHVLGGTLRHCAKRENKTDSLVVKKESAQDWKKLDLLGKKTASIQREEELRIQKSSPEAFLSSKEVPDAVGSIIKNFRRLSDKERTREVTGLSRGIKGAIRRERLQKISKACQCQKSGANRPKKSVEKKKKKGRTIRSPRCRTREKGMEGARGKTFSAKGNYLSWQGRNRNVNEKRGAWGVQQRRKRRVIPAVTCDGRRGPVKKTSETTEFVVASRGREKKTDHERPREGRKRDPEQSGGIEGDARGFGCARARRKQVGEEGRRNIVKKRVFIRDEPTRNRKFDGAVEGGSRKVKNARKNQKPVSRERRR